ncbi:MAG TPA: hypothetical protein VE687_01710 [Stellaceae bacterium]|nr:hypothetical protein [Stellaceae bacterium]
MKPTLPNLGRVIEVHAAIAEVKVNPGTEGVIDRADQLPIGMSADTKTAEIAIRGLANPLPNS